MKQLFLYLLLAFIFVSCGSNKVFPNRYIGNFHGVQDAFVVQIDGENVNVPAQSFDVTLNDNHLWLKSDKQTIEGKVILRGETKMYYSLDVEFENNIKEEWQLWKKGKRLIRKGIHPKPEVIFIKD
ncbi:MAG: hypothetical protein WC994_00030 [Brumimicrobium sp.]